MLRCHWLSWLKYRRHTSNKLRGKSEKSYGALDCKTSLCEHHVSFNMRCEPKQFQQWQGHVSTSWAAAYVIVCLGLMLLLVSMENWARLEKMCVSLRQEQATPFLRDRSHAYFRRGSCNKMQIQRARTVQLSVPTEQKQSLSRSFQALASDAFRKLRMCVEAWLIVTW